MAGEEGESPPPGSSILEYTRPLSWQEGRDRYNPTEPTSTEETGPQTVGGRTATDHKSEGNKTAEASEDLLAEAENTPQTQVGESKITLLKRKDTQVPLEEFIVLHPELLLGSGGSRIFIDEYQQLSVREVNNSTEIQEDESRGEQSAEQEWNTALEQLSLLENSRTLKD